MLKRTRKPVIDSSALIAFWKKEPGWDLMKKHQGKCLISSVNAAEVISRFIRKGLPLVKAQATVDNFVYRVIPFEMEGAVIASELALEGKKFGLSLGDRACLSLAMQKQATVLTADKIWQQLDIGVDVQLIR